MPETDVHQAQHFCERVCQEIGEMGIETKAGEISLSVSIVLTAFNLMDELKAVIERVDGRAL
jgi:PleD family two-component response regulator